MVRLEEEFRKEGTRANKIGLGMERGARRTWRTLCYKA